MKKSLKRVLDDDLAERLQRSLAVSRAFLALWDRPFTLVNGVATVPIRLKRNAIREKSAKSLDRPPYGD